MNFIKNKINWLKNNWLNLFVISLTFSTITFFSVWLYPWMKLTKQDWNRIQNSKTVNEKDKFNASLEIVKAIAGGAGTASAVVGAFVLYLNFRVGNRNADIANRNADIANRNAEIAHRNAELTELRLITERFSKAVEQLGSNILEVCLGGIYSLEKIAKDFASPYDYWIVLNILSAFIRETSLIEKNQNPIKNSLTYKQAIQAALTVVGRLNSKRDLSNNLLLNLTCARLNNFNFEGNFSIVNFGRSELHCCVLQGEFSNSFFDDAELQDAHLIKSKFQNASFENADFTKAILSDSDFDGAIFIGASLTSANVNEFTNFKKAKFSDINQIKAAHHYEKAIYDEDLGQLLNRPED